jgi:peptide/nickel transport system permease protein
LLQYTLRRLITLVPILVIVGFIVFMLIHLTPGDPARVILGPDASQEQVNQLQHSLGIDEPLPLQFVHWFSRAFTGDLGNSLYTGDPVLQEILRHIGPTLSLTLLAISMTLLIAIPSAIFAVSKRDSWLDPAFMSISLLGVSIPEFWFALLLILTFGVIVPVFPVAGYVPLGEGVWPWLHHLILPAFVLAALEMGNIARMLRDGMLEAVHQDYTRTARSKGVTERRILVKHVFFNAIIPTTTVIGVAIAGLMGGAIIAETIFTIPGIGHLLIGSIQRRDFPVIQGCTLFIAVVYVFVNLIIDLVYAVLDPRIRYD